MNEDTQTESSTEFVDEATSEELTLLKHRARLMGIQFSNNIGIPALRLKIEAKQKQSEGLSDDPEMVTGPNPLIGETKESGAAKPLSLRAQLQRDEMKLIRLRITNMDPKKRDLPGEIVTVGNEYLGMVSKFIPFGEATDAGYHVPHILYTFLKNRKFLNVKTTKRANGQIKIEQSWANEFALEILPPLTQEELNKLANAQAAAGVFAEETSSIL